MAESLMLFAYSVALSVFAMAVELLVRQVANMGVNHNPEAKARTTVDKPGDEHPSPNKVIGSKSENWEEENRERRPASTPAAALFQCSQ